MSFHFELDGGSTITLPTAGKYCDRDIVVTATDNGCATNHFVHSFVGDGSTSVSFCVPFEPDSLQIVGFDPHLPKRSFALAGFSCDLRAFGTLGGLAAFGSETGSSLSTALFTTTTLLNRYSRTEDGMVTIQNISSKGVFFGKDFVYTVIAVKYADRSDKERITDFVNNLTGSGTVALNQGKVRAAFTDEEWAVLIATKPEQTFSWI